jgi:glycine C-acetyltransferase
LRTRLFAAVRALRDGFAAHGITCSGSPSAIVPVPFRNDRLARLASRRIAESGVFVNVVEYPAVPIGEARLRMQVMATHTPEQAKEAVERIIAAKAAAEGDLTEWQQGAAVPS